MVRRLPFLLWGAVLLAGCGWVLAQEGQRPQPASDDQPPRRGKGEGQELGTKNAELPKGSLGPPKLDQLLKEAGYSGVEFRWHALSYPVVTAELGGQKINLVLDTGAPVTFLDRERTKHLKLEWKKDRQPVGGKGADWDYTTTSDVEGLEIGGLKTKQIRVYSFSISALGVKDSDDREDRLHGMLGADVLTRHAAVIDFGSRQLFLKVKQ